MPGDFEQASSYIDKVRVVKKAWVPKGALFHEPANLTFFDGNGLSSADYKDVCRFLASWHSGRERLLTALCRYVSARLPQWISMTFDIGIFSK